MTDFQALRTFVFSRLASPERLLPGEHYRAGTPSSNWGYRRWEQYLDDNDYKTSAEGVARFVEDLEAMRGRDFRAFHYGRGMLLGELPIMVDPDPVFAPEPPSTTKVQVRSRAQLVVARLREKVIQRLGRPTGTLPGESFYLVDSSGVWAMVQLHDHLESDISERAIDRAIEQIAALRERDRPAFDFGRNGLLEQLSVQLELPDRDPD
jgi:hypothetical protein